MNKSSTPPQLHFIKDEPADLDFFSSHDKVAAALASIIKTQPSINIIGLLGDWGSGKSTVVGLVQKLLKDPSDPVTTHTFYYDAWLHQNDPPRRAFLEALIRFYNSKRLTTESEWERLLGVLAGKIKDTETVSTPKFTPWGQWIFLSLLLVPLGMPLISYPAIDKAFQAPPNTTALISVLIGFLLTLAPAIVAILVYLYWRPEICPFRLEFWTTHHSPHENDSILAIFMNKAVERTKSTQVLSPEPTTIEFQGAFAKVMKAVDGQNRRFVFIIDNLDRLPEREAIEMWGTIRSFFLGEESATGKRIAPTVILPIDEKAVQRMYARSHGSIDAPGLARSFMDKTFDLTFRVTPPVMSNWKAFLERQLTDTFGDALTSDDKFKTTRLYQKYVERESSPVTPRKINAFVNVAGTLWLQWHNSSIPFIAVAYYALFRDQIDQDIQAAVASPLAGIDEFDREWQRSVAALHFGVDPNLAVQILIEQPMRKAIVGRLDSEFRSLMTVGGAEGVFQNIIETPALADPTTHAQFVCSAAIMLASTSSDPTRSAWNAHTWNLLRRQFSSSKTFGKLDPSMAIAIKEFLTNCPAAALPAFIQDAVDTLNNTSIASPHDAPEIFVNIARELLATTRSANLSTPEFVVPGDASYFLAVLTTAAQDAELLKAMKSGLTDSAVAQIVGASMGDAITSAFSENYIRALLAQRSDFDWTKVIEAAAAIVKQHNSAIAGIEPALYALGRLSSLASTLEMISELARTGNLQALLTNAWLNQAVLVEARTIALMLIAEIPLEAPSSVNWAQVVDSQPQLAFAINAALREFGAYDLVERLVTMSKSTPVTVPIVAAIISQRVSQSDIGQVSDALIVGDPAHYLNAVAADQKTAFIAQLAAKPSFWRALSDAPFDRNSQSLFYHLVGEGVAPLDQERAAEMVRTHLSPVTSPHWVTAIEKGGEPLDIALKFSTSGSEVQLGMALVTALQDTMLDLLTSADREYRVRWFGALSLVSPAATSTLLEGIKDRIDNGNTVVDLLSLLSVGGTQLLSTEGFIKRADDSVRNVILPLLKETAGREFLEQHSPQFESWVRNSSDGTRAFLNETIQEQYRSADETGQGMLNRLASAWKISTQ